MRIVSTIVAIIGTLGLLVGLVVFGYGMFQIWQQYLAMSADRSKEFINPMPMTALGTLVIAAGSFLLGLSIARRPKPKPVAASPSN